MQALVTMNDPVFLEAALQLAKQFKDKDSKTAILEMYQKATFRMAEQNKLKYLFNLFEEAVLSFEKDPNQLKDFFGLGWHIDIKTASLAIVANAIMNLDEFLTHG